MDILTKGIINEVHKVRIGVIGMGPSVGASLVSAVISSYIACTSKDVFYIGDASKVELGINKELKEGHILNGIYFAREESRTMTNGYLIFDNPKEIEKMDAILLVIDPLPKTMLSNLDIFKMVKRCEEDGKPTFYLINKMNKGVNLSILKKFFKEDFKFVQEMISEEEIYRKMYRAEPLFKHEQYEGISKIAQYIVCNV